MSGIRTSAPGGMFLLTVACVAMSLASGPVRAQDDNDAAAVALGELLGAEGFCGLTYDQTAIGNFIDRNGRKDDAAFSSTLRMVTGWTRYQDSTMSASAKADRCAEIERMARSYGLIR